MGTWCTEGVKRQFAEANQRNMYNQACDDKKKLEEENEQLKKRIRALTEEKKGGK